MKNPEEVNLWALVRPAPDVPGQWVAHCLDIDVVTQGNDFRHTLSMLQEAVHMVVEDSLQRGYDVFARKAPEEDWAELHRVMRVGEFKDLSNVSGDAFVAAVRLGAKRNGRQSRLPSSTGPR